MLKPMALVLVLLCGAAVAVPTAENWPQWRGPSLNGLSGEHNLPIRWSTTENIAWKLALPAFRPRRPSSGAIASSSTSPTAAIGSLELWAIDRTRAGGLEAPSPAETR